MAYPPPPPPDFDDGIPPPPATDSDEDSDLDLLAASTSASGASSAYVSNSNSSRSSDDESDHQPRSPPTPKPIALPPPSPIALGHNRRKSAMNIFDSESQQSFHELEARIQHEAPIIQATLPTPISAAGSSTGSFSLDNSRMSSASLSSNTSSFSPPMTGSRLASASVAPTSGAPTVIMQRRGSDFRQRINSVTGSTTQQPSAANGFHSSPLLLHALVPQNGYGTLSSKTKCLMPGCTAFSARNQYCLRHVWRISVEELEPVNQKQYQVAKEIVTTEKSYSDGLRIIWKSFVLRITTQNDMQHSEKPLLETKELNRIFHNIEDLYRLAENLYLDLEEITLEKVLTTQIGTTLLHYAPQFRIYQTYLENYDDAIKTLNQVRKDKPEFDFFCKLSVTATSDEDCMEISTENTFVVQVLIFFVCLDLLLVKKNAKYLLLLTELIKRSETSTTVPESSLQDMIAAKEKIGNIAHSINLSLHQKEAQIKVIQIQNCFERDARYQDLATPTRYLVREGPLKKRYGKGSRHLTSSTVYHFFLFNDIMVYADFKKQVIGQGVSYKLKHILPLAGMTVEATSSSKGKNKDITVTTKSADAKSFDLSCADTADRDSWMKDIQGAIDKLESETRSLKTTSFDGTNPMEKANKSSKLKAMMGV